MTLRIVIRPADPSEGHSWTKLAEDAPDGWLLPQPDGGFTLSRGEAACTGTHLVDAGDETLVLELPLFMSPTDYVALGAFVPKVCERVGAEYVEISEEQVRARDFVRVLDDQLVPQLVQHAMGHIPQLVEDTDGVLVIDGIRRPFLLGRRVLEEVVRDHPPAEAYDAIVERASRLQTLVADPDIVKGTVTGIERDGERMLVADWNTEVRMLTLAFDVLVIDAKGHDPLHVALEHVPHVVDTLGERIDQRSWLLSPPADEDRAALLARAATFHDSVL